MCVLDCACGWQAINIQGNLLTGVDHSVDCSVQKQSLYIIIHKTLQCTIYIYIYIYIVQLLYVYK